MGERIEKVKVHIREHKTVYCCVGTGIAVAGITALIMRGRHAELRSGSDTAELSVFVRPLSFFSKQKVITNVVNVLEREGRGHPGYAIYCIELDKLFESQKAAALSQEVSDAIMSLHVRGKLPDVNGLHFERITSY